MKKIFCLFIAVLFGGWVSAGSLTVQVNVPVGDSLGTQIEAGAFNTSKDNLNAEAGNMWGVSNSGNRDGMLRFTYSGLAGSTLPPTIQPGTYTFAARIGNGNVFAFSGLNDITAGTSTDKGNVAGFFTTLNADAQVAKNNMYTEFNAISGVTYAQATEAAPADLTFTTWTFTWTIAARSSVVGSDPYFGVFTKTGTTGGSGFWDDSILSYSRPGTVIAIQ